MKFYKRTKRQGLREARATEKLEKQQKLEAERKRRQKHLEFLSAVLQHGKDLREYHRNNKAQLARMNKSVMNYHANAEREQKKEQERIEKERMRRLMAEDEEGYRKLIDQKKDKRLAFLLSQTDEYISNLTQMVKQHKDDQMKKKEEEGKRLQQYKKELLMSGEYVNIDESSIAADMRVHVVEQCSGKKLTGDDAPMLKHLHRWLNMHPGWDWIDDDDDDNDESPEKKPKPKLEEQPQERNAAAEGSEDATDKSAQPGEAGANDLINQVKVEDDEYRTEEQTYYSIAHTVHEKVTEQASIMVNGQLKEYQLKGLEWLVSLYNNNLNGILADEMGLGKTIQTISLVTYLMDRKKVMGPYLIIVPLSTLPNWVLEFEKWAPAVGVVSYKGSPQGRRLLQNQMRATKLVIFDSDWNPHQDLQAQDRAHRIGQRNEVRVLRLMTVNSVEERILAAARYKLNMDEKVIQAGMFDQKSTGSERQQFLQTILHQDDNEEEEENEVPDDEMINMMIARSEEEIEIFKKMDIERKKEDEEIHPGRERLIDESELPDWLTKDDDEVERFHYQYDEDTILGRGSRQRKEVDYTDSLTEKEWLKAIDDGAEFDEEEEEDLDSKRKRRKRKNRKDESDDDSLILKRRRRQNLDKRSKKQMHKIMSAVIKHTQDGRTLSEPFMKLPSRQRLPDYYDIIKRPVDIKKILQRIEDCKYADLNELEKDFMQLCQNAQIYNEEASLIYLDSIALQKIFVSARQRVTAAADAAAVAAGENTGDAHGNGGGAGGSDNSDNDDDDGDDGSDDEEIATTSAAAVKMKLKLNKSLASAPATPTQSSAAASVASGAATTSKKQTRRKRAQKKYTISDDDDDDMD
ncbi:PREDICTED: ATP-dependent helicase brm [Drosophila arizonae]|uniref:ATP-dependent helicase brm n=1 Tax=Drosophila arizonae TaxID=7263 RepID=A0ABM1P0G8_DROAR|nr:PREDICTED: ATP-dependent helicase brm [Drosophila arizonae]